MNDLEMKKKLELAVSAIMENMAVGVLVELVNNSFTEKHRMDPLKTMRFSKKLDHSVKLLEILKDMGFIKYADKSVNVVILDKGYKLINPRQ